MVFCEVAVSRLGAMARNSPSAAMPIHEPAMVRQVLQLTRPGRGEKVLDLTVGTGGHALALAEGLGAEGFLLGLDRDGAALKLARTRLSLCSPCQFALLQCRFSRAREAAQRQGICAFDVVLADLGVGTHQMDDPARGFSFDSEHRLDMRYETTQRLTAWHVINELPRNELADIFYRLGQERYSRQIAEAICRHRQQHSIETPAELARLIKAVVARYSKGRTWRIHPATRVMMSLRSFVNEEPEELQAMLELLPELLAPGGRAALLTYHSLEARRVKHAWREQEKKGLLKILTRRPLRPHEAEIKRNPRARSCQLRAALGL